MRIGAVNYLNSKPLVCGLDLLAPGVRLLYDLPSRLADSLAAERLDAALIPSVEWFRQAGRVPPAEYTIVSDACVACRGPVLSVKLYFRVRPTAVRRLALDEGSRTSAALAQILLERLAGVTPDCEPLPIGSGFESTDADAVLVIGDRAIQSTDCSSVETWDLGERWYAWTGLPFVFAMWVARRGVDTAELAVWLAAARDRGLSNLDVIARQEAAALGISTELATRYLRDNLQFTFGDRELDGLRRFAALCADRGLAPAEAVRSVQRLYADGCTHE